jgi:hypothetical protein
MQEQQEKIGAGTAGRQGGTTATLQTQKNEMINISFSVANLPDKISISDKKPLADDENLRWRMPCSNNPQQRKSIYLKKTPVVARCCHRLRCK